MVTGAVTYEQIASLFNILIAAGGILAVAGGAVAGLLAWLWRIVTMIRRSYEADRDKLAARLDEAEAEMVAYKSHVAETYASKSGVSVQIDRLEQAVNGIAEKVDNSSHRITERIDRLLENQVHGTPTPRRRSSG